MDGKSCLRPFTSRESSLYPFQPYSLCMSKTRLDAAPFWRIPASRSLVRKVLPVPLFPKTPLLRITSSGMSRQSLVSMSRGLPIQKWRSSSSPNTSWTSPSEASWTGEKWGGTVLAGCGPSPSASGSLPNASIGSTAMAPNAVVPWTTSAMNGSDTSGGVEPMDGSEVSRDTSLTTAKNRISLPCMVTYLPTLTSSISTSRSSRTFNPSVSEPSTTIPSRSPARESFTERASSAVRSGAARHVLGGLRSPAPLPPGKPWAPGGVRSPAL